jgi:hypothetical protein
MSNPNPQISDNFPRNLNDEAAYQRWRSVKLAQTAELLEDYSPVEIADLSSPTAAERTEMLRRCRISNAALYRCTAANTSAETVTNFLIKFADSFGLRIAEKHRSAGKHGIVWLQQNDSVGKKGYIPYSRRPMNWHTDGYYNAPDQKISAMVLHCFRSADNGGINQFIDNEIAYIRLRDENPDYITALMHPEAMTIPENDEGNGKIRPVSIGPVFSFDAQTGALEMRYTARTRSIEWRDDPETRDAVAFLTKTLASDDPFIQTVKMESGMGILCNNSLHNRTGYDADTTETGDRLMMRVRFHNRVKGN